MGALKPTQIADLLEDADTAEVLDRVRSNPELDADVFVSVSCGRAIRDSRRGLR